MAKAQAINRRIKSVRNAKQITKAMEVVAASRMRKVQAALTGSRSYLESAQEILYEVVQRPEAKINSYFSESKSRGALVVIFTSDRGLAGAFNSNVLSRSVELIEQKKLSGEKVSVIVFGTKGARFFSRAGSINLIGEYQQVPDAPVANFFAPVLGTIKGGFLDQTFGNVSLIYTKFSSALKQSIETKQLLPLIKDVPDSDSKISKTVYEFEPAIEDVLKRLVDLYLEASLIGAKVESTASEYAMRMMAMGNASRNATDLIDGLTLELNATRQAAITQEIAEITGGAAAVI